MTQRLLLTEPQADHLSVAIEDGIEEAHAETLEFGEGEREFDEAVDRIAALKAILDQIDPENPILSADAKPGREFDWEEFWKSVESAESDEDEDDSDAPGTGISVAEDRSVATPDRG